MFETMTSFSAPVLEGMIAGAPGRDFHTGGKGRALWIGCSPAERVTNV